MVEGGFTRLVVSARALSREVVVSIAMWEDHSGDGRDRARYTELAIKETAESNRFDMELGRGRWSGRDPWTPNYPQIDSR